MPGACLIGHTGFVGGNLSRHFPFDDFYNSRNIDTIRGKSYDLLVCSGVSAVKWQANRFPAEDRAEIDRLLQTLTSVKAHRTILISTIDVYPRTVGVDETVDPHGEANHPYGTNRLYVEDKFRQLFDRVHVVRLPGLFGPGLKKNVIFDLLHDNGLDVINPESAFQFYDVRRLWQDLQLVLQNDLELVNFATEPVQTSEIIRRYFPGKKVGSQASPAAFYDFRTLYAERFGGRGGYIYDAEKILTSLGEWIQQDQKRVVA